MPVPWTMRNLDLFPDLGGTAAGNLYLPAFGFADTAFLSADLYNLTTGADGRTGEPHGPPEAFRAASA